MTKKLDIAHDLDKFEEKVKKEIDKADEKLIKFTGDINPVKIK